MYLNFCIGFEFRRLVDGKSLLSESIFRFVADRELENYKEAMSSVEELELTAEEGDMVPYRVGDVFFNFSFSDASSKLETEKADLEQERSKKLEEKAQLEGEMSGLKAELYSKFGDQINLDPDAE